MTKVEFLTWLQTAKVGDKLHFEILDDSDDADYEESDYELTEDYEFMEVIVDGCGGNCIWNISDVLFEETYENLSVIV